MNQATFKVAGVGRGPIGIRATGLQAACSGLSVCINLRGFISAADFALALILIKALVSPLSLLVLRCCCARPTGRFDRLDGAFNRPNPNTVESFQTRLGSVGNLRSQPSAPCNWLSNYPPAGGAVIRAFGIGHPVAGGSCGSNASPHRQIV